MPFASWGGWRSIKPRREKEKEEEKADQRSCGKYWAQHPACCVVFCDCQSHQQCSLLQEDALAEATAGGEEETDIIPELGLDKKKKKKKKREVHWLSLLLLFTTS